MVRQRSDPEHVLLFSSPAQLFPSLVCVCDREAIKLYRQSPIVVIMTRPGFVGSRLFDGAKTGQFFVLLLRGKRNGIFVHVNCTNCFPKRLAPTPEVHASIPNLPWQPAVTELHLDNLDTKHDIFC